MPVYASVQVVGLKEALRELNSMDKKLRRQITRDYKAIVGPIAQDARTAIDAIREEPMSGWARNWNPAKGRSKKSRPWKFQGGRQRRDAWTEAMRDERMQEAAVSGGIFPWDSDPAKRMIKMKINTKQPREYAGALRNLQVFTLSWLGSANEIFEMAGRESSGKTPQGKQMIATLNARYGKPGRILWQSYDKNKDLVDKELKLLVNKVMAAVNRKPPFTPHGEVK